MQDRDRTIQLTENLTKNKSRIRNTHTYTHKKHSILIWKQLCTLNSTQLHFVVLVLCSRDRKRNFIRKDPQHRPLMSKNHAICGSVTFLLSFEMKAQIELRLRYDHTVVNSHITIIDSLAGTEHNGCYCYYCCCCYGLQFFHSKTFKTVIPYDCVY